MVIPWEGVIMYVYKITNKINNKCYIGCTEKSIEYRFAQHKNSNKQYPLYKDFKIYGIENFTLELLEKCCSREEALSLEKYYIKFYNSTSKEYGYNTNTGGEDNIGTDNPRALVTDDIVLEIRKLRFSGKVRCSKAYEKYSHIIAFSTFEKIWEGVTWTHIGQEYLNVVHNPKHKGLSGSENGNAIYTEDEVLAIRQYYTNHTLRETYEKYGAKSKSKDSFRGIIDVSYKHLPVYSKTKKCWLLDNKEINIDDYTTPVSTISVSGE